MMICQARRPSTLRAVTAWWLLVCAVIVRALIPVGFMPDEDALRAGRLALMLCPQAGSPALPDGESHGQAHGAMHAMHGTHASDIDNSHATGVACPFWLTAQAAWPPPAPVALLASGQAVSWWALAAMPDADPPRFATAGPPLGSRAPPAVQAMI